MRKLLTVSVLSCLMLIALSLPVTASAAPAVAVKAKIVPIPIDPSSPHSPTYPGTGNILGAGAALEATLTISGTEYGGFPSPITRVVVELPAGTKLHQSGFATCPTPILESHEVAHCPKKSFAGPVGEVLGVVSFGSTRVQEKATIQAFFAPGNKLAFYTEGTSPASLEILTIGSFSTAPPPFGPMFTVPVPLVLTVPEAPYASVLSIKGKIGAAYKQGKKLISYGTVPKTCPKGGFTGRVELTFLSGETVTVDPTVPCPKR
ncbi:MAG TPA: hypothetical protein VK781_08335 [Solirubrobacteraceae bacterium]|jgi:hypothetical protein|nr:hypothetical protein [Solirubrobacteraceae bacterium]